MKRLRMKRLHLLLLPFLALCACSIGGGGSSPIEGGAAPRKPTESGGGVAMPTALESDHLNFAMQELMRVYQSSLILLTTRDRQDDFTLGCVQYKRVNDSSETFRKASFKDCSWRQSFGDQVFSWQLGGGKNDGEIFQASGGGFSSTTLLNLSATPAAALSSSLASSLNGARAAAKPILSASYKRRVLIGRKWEPFSLDQPEEQGFTFFAKSFIGNPDNRVGDYWETKSRGKWALNGSGLRGRLSMDFLFRPAKTKDRPQPDLRKIVFESENVSVQGGKCPRLLGTFSWLSSNGDDKIISSGEFEATKDGWQTSKAGKITPWPKSCLEFPTDDP